MEERRRYLSITKKNCLINSLVVQDVCSSVATNEYLSSLIQKDKY